MAWLLEVAIVDPGDGTIKVVHHFYGVTEEEADKYYEEHIGTCKYLASAFKDGRAIALMEKIPDEELPTEEALREEEAKAEEPYEDEEEEPTEEEEP